MQIDPTSPSNNGNNRNSHLLALADVVYERFSNSEKLYVDNDVLTKDAPIPVMTKRGVVDVDVAIHHGYLVAYPRLKTNIVSIQGEKQEIKLENPYHELIFPSQEHCQKAIGETRKAIVKEIAKAIRTAASNLSSDRKQALKQLKSALEEKEVWVADKLTDVPFALELKNKQDLLTLAAYHKLTGRLPAQVDEVLEPGSVVYAGRHSLNIFGEKQQEAA